MASLWTPKLRRDFHRAVERLANITQNPLEEIVYGGALAESTPTHYSLKLRDELQLADHIAFLAHSQEGVDAVSAACVEDNDAEIIIRLASNHSPSEATVLGLRKILHTFHEGAYRGIPNDTLQDIIFQDVLDLSQERILQRIRPHWIPTPPHFRSVEEPLWERIEGVLTPLRSRRVQTLYAPMLARIDRLLSSTDALKLELYGSRLRGAITNTVRCCAEVSYGGGYKSLEEQLRDLPRGQYLLGAKEVIQIDKLARYWGLCKDLAKLSRKRPFRSGARMITLEPLTAFEAERPVGASRRCHVHAEVQLILHYEQYPLDRPPRAIGCSKSACFLCDMLIQKLGKYRISSSHRRLYTQWTIKDVTWMTAERRLQFQHILKSMIDDMERLENTGQARRRRPYGLESRAVLPLSSNSSLSRVSDRTVIPPLRNMASKDRSLPVAEPAPASSRASSRWSSGASSGAGPQAAASSSVSVIQPNAVLPSPIPSMILNLGKINLPYQLPLSSGLVMHVDLGQLFLILEFPSSSAGSLAIRKVEKKEASQSGECIRRVKVHDIPASELNVGRVSAVSSDFKLWLHMDDVEAIEIEIIWRDQLENRIL